MKNILFLFGIMCLAWSARAQQTTFEGVVQDSLNNPMELANVMAFYKRDSIAASYALTDSDGRYLLKLKEGEEYWIKCSYLGYEPWEGIFVAKGKSMTQLITLTESTYNLDGVEIVYEFPVTISGDTITYKTDAFTNGKERKLKNVLEKLPGFEVDKNGVIRVQGKKVDKVLVEGKEFFDGDSKMAVNNIPADVIDKIDLLQNYNEIGAMSGLGNNESLALNIQLVDGNKSMWFGDVEAGGGPDERYLAHPNVFYYSPKTSINFIGDINNIGEQAFTMRDYFRFNGGFESMGGNAGSSFSLASDELGIAMMQNDRAFETTSALAALNITHTPNKKWSLSSYGIFSGVDNQLKTRSLRNYVGTQTERNEVTESNLNQTLGSGMLKIEATYKPNPQLFISYQGFAKTSSIEDEDNRLSTFSTTATPNTILESNRRDPFSIDQKLTYFQMLDEHNIISADASWKYKKQRPNYFLQTETKPFDSVLPISDSQDYRLNQDKKILSNTVDASFNYYYLINPRNHINFTSGLNLLDQYYQSGIEQILDNGISSQLPQDRFSNDANYNISDNYVSAHYKTQLGKLTLSPGINWHYYSLKDNQSGNNLTSIKTLWLPDFFAKYKFGSSENITLNYSVNTEFTDVQNAGNATIIRNYNSLFYGNRSLENLWYHSLNLSYMNFDMYNFTNFYFMVNYQKRFDDINESVVYSGTDRLSVPTNALLTNDILMSNASYEKRFTFLKATATANVSYSNFQNSVELEQNRNKSLSQTYQLSAETNFSVLPNLEIGIKNTWANYQSSSIDQTYITNSPYAKLEVVIPGGFIITADYEYTDYHAKDNETSSYYDFLKAAIYYRKDDSPWEFKIAGNNLLNTESIRRDSFSDNVISTYQYFVQPRYVMFTAKFDL